MCVAEGLEPLCYLRRSAPSHVQDEGSHKGPLSCWHRPEAQLRLSAERAASEEDGGQESLAHIASETGNFSTKDNWVMARVGRRIEQVIVDCVDHLPFDMGRLEAE